VGNIDFTKAHITLEDGTVFQVLDSQGVFDDAATAAAVAAHLEGATS
jgi:hypothetical protein